MTDDSAAIWAGFDAVVAGQTTSPWRRDGSGQPEYHPDVDTLLDLLRVPLTIPSKIQSGWHAKAVDVWISHELRRAGFGEDEVWPRRSAPRVMPREVSALLEGLPRAVAADLADRLRRNPMGVVPSEARVLGKAYFKQIDVLVSQWARGPELMISTKRLGSSLANNALNRVEESYGDAHNLRGRHPLAAIGYVLVLRKEAVDASPRSAARLLDLVGKLGSDPAGYDASAVVVVDWDESPGLSGDHGLRLEQDDLPVQLAVAPFLSKMITTVLDRTPIEIHGRARDLYAGFDDPH